MTQTSLSRGAWMRILLADHRSEVRYALRALLGQRPGLKVVGEAVDAKTLMTQVRVACPDVVLLDWRLQGLAAVNLLPALRRICPQVAVIALSVRPEERQAALDAGVDAFVSKADPPERLLATIDGYRADNTDGVEG